MTNAVQAKTQTTNEYFLLIPHRLLKARGFVCRKTGGKFDLSLIQLAIFQYMKDFYESCKKMGKPYHESQRSIGNACRVSRDIVIKAMKLFEHHGYLIKEPKWEGCKWVLPYALEVVSEEVQEKPTPQHPTPAVMPSHLQEDIPDGYYDEHCRREYDFVGMEIDDTFPF